MAHTWRWGPAIALASAACAGHGAEPAPTIAPGVVFTYPVDRELDIPLGARLIVSFSDPIVPEAMGSVTVAGPDGNVDIAVKLIGGGKSLAITSSAFAPGTAYEVSVGAAVSPTSENLPAGPLIHFTTRSDRPRAGAPALIALNGSDPLHPGDIRPLLDTSTLQLVFSEPLDPRSVVVEPGALQLVDTTTGTDVAVTLFARGIHVTLDPDGPLAPGDAYELRLGARIVDLGGEAVAATAIAFTPRDSLGTGGTSKVFRTRGPGDAVAAISRTDAMNQMTVSHPLVGELTGAMMPSSIASELGDPKALGGPIAFTIPRGQQLGASSLDIALAGAVPSGLSTGDLTIELVADAGGLIYRNRFHSDDTTPDNDRSPLLVDLSFDIALYAKDPTGNAVLADTVLGVQLSGLAMADDGALAIETLGAMEIELLGIAAAPTNLVLDLISDPDATAAVDQQPPSLVTALPAADTHDLVPDQGIELIFDEPIDIDRARTGGVVLRETGGGVVPSTLELYGSVLVVRPRASLPDDRGYRIELGDVADLAGNAMPLTSFAVATPAMIPTTAPPSVVSVYPGTACALVGASATSAGRCAGGATTDLGYRPFTLAANERIQVVFDQPVAAPSVALGTACDNGSVRIELIDHHDRCVAVVAGTLEARRRELVFVPDHPWLTGEHYRLRLVSGPDATCNPGELCGTQGHAASFDPLAGTTAGGGPDLVIDFLGAPSTSATSLMASMMPYTDLDASGVVETGELRRDDNRVALRIAGTSGLIGSATFQEPDCVPETPGVEACMYMVGAMPAQLGERRDNCTLPDGSMVATCVPVTLSAQTMFATSITMTATVLGIGINAATGKSVMRVRERADGPLEGYIVDREGTPTMVVALDLYMDAPDMALPIGQHDMHSKPLSVALEGPVLFQPDGRIAIDLSNNADVAISVGITALGLGGAINLVVPKHQMKLRLMSPPQRGSLP